MDAEAMVALEALARTEAQAAAFTAFMVDESEMRKIAHNLGVELTPEEVRKWAEAILTSLHPELLLGPNHRPSDGGGVC